MIWIPFSEVTLILQFKDRQALSWGDRMWILPQLLAATNVPEFSEAKTIRHRYPSWRKSRLVSHVQWHIWYCLLLFIAVAGIWRSWQHGLSCTTKCLSIWLWWHDKLPFQPPTAVLQLRPKWQLQIPLVLFGYCSNPWNIQQTKLQERDALCLRPCSLSACRRTGRPAGSRRAPHRAARVFPLGRLSPLVNSSTQNLVRAISVFKNT